MIDNSFKLIGTVVSPIKTKQNGNYTFNYMEMEVEGGTTEKKTNTIWVKLKDKILDRYEWKTGVDLSGSVIAIEGYITGSNYNGNNYLNIETTDLVILSKYKPKSNNTQTTNTYNVPSVNNNTQPAYTPENNYGLTPQDDEFIDDDSLPF